MYKITLYDQCSSPIADGTISYYVDDLNEFEQKWLPIVKHRNPELIEKYFRSKAGEIVSDWYHDTEELNIVQKDENAVVMEEQEFEEKELYLSVANFYECTTNYHIMNLNYAIRKIKYGGDYFLVAKYKIKGICIQEENYDRWSDTIFQYKQANYYGNFICELNFKKLHGFDKKRPKEQLWVSNQRDHFKEDSIECFVWLPIQYGDENMQIHRLSKEELNDMLSDIPGEAG